MTKPALVNILGLPSDVSPNGRTWGDEHNGRLTMDHERVVWGGNDGAAVVVFDETGRVAQKAWVDNQEAFFDKVRRWLRA